MFAPVSLRHVRFLVEKFLRQLLLFHQTFVFVEKFTTHFQGLNFMLELLSKVSVLLLETTQLLLLDDRLG